MNISAFSFDLPGFDLPSLDLILALLAFSFATAITPGPNNLLLMSSGANFGMRQTLPLMLGIIFGHGFLVFVFGLGLTDLFEAFPDIRFALTVVCSLYLLWLAWAFANAAPVEEGEVGKPLTFLQALLFQWMNPKGIYMAITAQTHYAPEGAGWIGALYVACGFGAISWIPVVVWAWSGVQMKRFLSLGNRLRIFNMTMGILLVVTLIPIVSDLL